MLKDINTVQKDRLLFPISKRRRPMPREIFPGYMFPPHRKKVEEAIEFLHSQGFSDNEIYAELAIKTEQRIRSVDVAGIKPGKRIAIECGTCPPINLELIGPYFDQVLHFPYPSKELKKG